MTTLEVAAKAAKREIDKLRKTRVPEYPGSWKANDGLGWENLDDVVAATTRAVLMAVRDPGSDLWNQANNAAWQNDRSTVDHTPEAVWPLMIDAILADRFDKQGCCTICHELDCECCLPGCDCVECKPA